VQSDATPHGVGELLYDKHRALARKMRATPCSPLSREETGEEDELENEQHRDGGGG